MMWVARMTIGARPALCRFMALRILFRVVRVFSVR
jgi:hypothetical protein